MLTQYLYAGIDLHKKFSFVTVIDQDGHRISSSKVPNTEYAIQSSFSRFNCPLKAAVEATFNSYWIVDQLNKVSIPVDIANPTKIKAIASSKIKTDKIDSSIIADLCRTNLLPISYIPTIEERQLKDTIRHRFSLVQARTSLKNQAKTILLRNCIFEFPYKNIFGKKGQLWLKQLTTLKTHELGEIMTYLDLINTYSSKIDQIDSVIKVKVKDDHKTKLLMTIPGIGPISAYTIIAESGDISRFKSSKNYTSYLGLVPSTHSSGGKTFHGPIIKTGCELVRHVLSEAIEHTVKMDIMFKNKFKSLIVSKGRSKAKVICMRKLATYIFIMLKYDLEYNQLKRDASFLA